MLLAVDGALVNLIVRAAAVDGALLKHIPGTSVDGALLKLIVGAPAVDGALLKLIAGVVGGAKLIGGNGGLLACLAGASFSPGTPVPGNIMPPEAAAVPFGTGTIGGTGADVNGFGLAAAIFEGTTCPEAARGLSPVSIATVGSGGM